MRLDKYLTGKFGSRTKASSAILSGLVLVNDKKVSPSYVIKADDDVTFLEPEESFVSNGGYKLSKALKDFNFSVKDKIFADIGASTGGFTDCLLQNGAKKLYCIDVGESQLDNRLLNEKVIVIDNFNARYLNGDMFDEKLNGVVIDVSFISLTYILKAVADIIDDEASVIALIKPQFECESRNVGKGGIVRNPEQRKRAISKICIFSKSCGLFPQKITTAPVIQGKNIEYLILLKKDRATAIDEKLLIKSIKL